MKTNILKCGLVSVTAVAALIAIFTGCSEGSSDPYEITSSASISSSSAPPYSAPAEETAISPIRVSDFQIVWNGDKTMCTFQGSAFLDGWDTLANVSSLNEPFFTNVYLDFQRVDENGNTFVTPLSALLHYNKGPFPSAVINFAQMDVGFEDLNKIECGNYRLIAYFFATNDTMGTESYNPDKYITTDTLEFSREESFCVATPVESSSSEAVVSNVELVMGVGEASASTGTSVRSFDFITGTQMMVSEGGQVSFSLTEDEIIVLTGINGYQVTDYTNDNAAPYEDDWYSESLPPDPVHLSDFRFNKSTLAETFEGFENSRFYIVVGPNYNPETGDDFFALTLKDKENKNGNGIQNITIIYYKKK